jgi:nicotinamide-nucleotide amidase
MKRDVLFVGNRLILNEAYERYILRSIKEKLSTIDSISYFEESDKGMFLHLDALLSCDSKVVIITTKSTFTIIGKLLSTITADNQILKNNMLIPSRASILEQGSYLLSTKTSEINVILAHEGKVLPPILIDDENKSGYIHVFNEERSTTITLLESLASTFDVKLESSQLIDGWVKIKITSRKHGNMGQFIASAKGLLPNKVIASSNIAAYIIDKLSKNNKKISFAESCSGGSLAYYFTSQNGASTVYEGSLITYDNILKANWLAVEEESLQTHGAVSADVVNQMSEGALNVSYADFALSISGIAGPTGAVEGKPVGTVYISARTKHIVHAQRFNFQGDRNYIQEQSVLMAVKMLLDVDKELFFG